MSPVVRVCWSLLFLFGALLAAPPARALDSGRTIGQLHHVWYENQLPQGTVLSIAQRQDGSIWLATYGGLIHYSGAEFDTIDPRVAPVLKSTAITAVAVDRAGILWVGSLNDGLYRSHGLGDLESVALPANIKSIFGIVQSKSGALWATTNAGVLRIDPNNISQPGEESGFPRRGFYRAIVADAVNGVWLAADGVGVVHWRDGHAKIFNTHDGLPSNAVNSLAVDREGTLWVGTQAGPARFRNGRFERDPRATALDEQRIFSLYGDRDGNMWFAPIGMGVCRLTPTRFECDNTLNGLVAETVRSMYEDREGNLWMGTTSSGLHRFSDSKLVTVTGKMDSNSVRAVFQDRAGTLWIGTDGSGLARYDNHVLVPVQAINTKLPNLLLRAIASDGDGNLWVGSLQGAARIAPDGTLRNFTIDDGLPGTLVFAFAPSRDGGMWIATLQGVAKITGDNISVVEGTRGDDVRAMHEDRSGRLWIGERNGLRCLRERVLDRCGTDGLPGVSVFAFHPQDTGDMWLGTSVGLTRIRAGSVESFTQGAGFYGDSVFSILDDEAGNFWVSSNRGIARIARADLDALAAGKLTQIVPQWYGKNDGMLSQQANGASQTPAWRTADGRMWFGTTNGVVIVDPNHLRTNRMPPPVAVERVLVDGKEKALETVGRLGPDLERMEFHYAAMTYVAPAAVKYRYRLDGFDRDWVDAGSSRVAYFTNLPSGNYVFRVIASNNDGVWNTDGASVTFTIVPHWYATWWMRVVVAFAALGVLAAVYWLRVWRLYERERVLTSEVAQRTEALREANAELKRIAALDSLTLIANRGAFDERLREALDEHTATGTSLAVLMCDVDEFKPYNDTYGHLAGDAALIAVASALTSVLRLNGADMAARYGGEEFAVLLAGCERTEAIRVAQRMVEAVRALAIDHRTSRAARHVTVSVGLTAGVPTATDAPERLLHRADEALYRAKAEGRDRVVGESGEPV